MSKTKLIAGLLLGLVALTPRFLAQDDHAPLPEQCIADYNLWSAGDDIAKLSVPVIQPREIEMWNCEKVVKSYDSEHETIYSVKMIFLESTYSAAIRSRALDFIQRHGLLEKFAQEDAEGQR